MKKETIKNDPTIIYSNYCIYCWKEKKRAVGIYKGNSLCEDCFENALIFTNE